MTVKPQSGPYWLMYIRGFKSRRGLGNSLVRPSATVAECKAPPSRRAYGKGAGDTTSGCMEIVLYDGQDSSRVAQKKYVLEAGLEPATLGLLDPRANQLGHTSRVPL